jgi:hypothetical protein
MLLSCTDCKAHACINDVTYAGVQDLELSLRYYQPKFVVPFAPKTVSDNNGSCRLHATAFGISASIIPH